MSDEAFGEFRPVSPLVGHLSKDFSLSLKWFPNYIEEFPIVLEGVTVKWDNCRFTRQSCVNVPEAFGVYCFTATLGKPFPESIGVLLYIGKASDQYLSERYKDYLKEINSGKGRRKVVGALRKYKSTLNFWWCSLPSIHVEVVERHLLMCCEPPGNDQFPSKRKHWGNAFGINQEED